MSSLLRALVSDSRLRPLSSTTSLFYDLLFYDSSVPVYYIQTRCSPNSVNNQFEECPPCEETIAALQKMGFFGLKYVMTTRTVTDFLECITNIYNPETNEFAIRDGISLRLTEEDVQAVYDLPRGSEPVNVDKLDSLTLPEICELLECTEKETYELVVAPMTGNKKKALKVQEAQKVKRQRAQRRYTSVTLGSLREKLKQMKEASPNYWAKLLTLHALGALLCPGKKDTANLKYLRLAKENIENFARYNRCRHVLNQFDTGMTDFCSPEEKSADNEILDINEDESAEDYERDDKAREDDNDDAAKEIDMDDVAEENKKADVSKKKKRDPTKGYLGVD
ncbi:hypothetical protein LINGRAHAP2_LOCUS22675 [Linum grandiflorum]